MKQIYYWETNTIDFEDDNGSKFILTLRDGITQLKGESGVGKTYLCKQIEKIQSQGNSKYKADGIVIANKNNIKYILENSKQKLIIVDNAHLVLTDDLVDIINMDENNRYLIITRVSIGLEISPNHQADMILTNNLATLKYRFSVKGWC